MFLNIKTFKILSLVSLFIFFLFAYAKITLAQTRDGDSQNIIRYENNSEKFLIKLIAEKKNHFTFVRPPAAFTNKQHLNKIQTATINVTYNGFSSEALTAFQYAIDILETEITSPVPIEVVATWEPLGTTGILGSAGPWTFYRSIPNEPVANSWYPVALANKLNGADIDPNNPDIDASFNSQFTEWYFGIDGITPVGKYDFVSVVMHEIIHGLGFIGSMEVSVNLGKWGYNSGYPFIYDRFTVNGSDQLLISAFNNPSVQLGNQLKSNNLFFNGAGSIFANGGTKPKIYAPSTWQPGSSYSHWDEATYPAGNINSLMTPALGGAEAIHNPGFITRGLLQDIGWTIDQPLPVELSSFLASVMNSYIKLKWTTKTEINNYGFDIQRKASRNDWATIGFVEGYGNSNSPKEYSFSDKTPIGGSEFQYRLKQIDNDGQFEYSKVVEAELVPNEYAIFQNYPNPFNPVTTIRYQLPKEGKVIIKIYNILGSEVMELLNDKKEAGIYELEFSARNLSSGTYVYRLMAGDYVQTRKMILLK